MGPSQSQLKLLSPEDRALYKKWLRAGLLFYGSILGLLIFAAVVSRVVTPLSPDGDEMRTAAISARK
jgi:hypothetical protein